MTIKRTSQEFRVEEVLARAPGREISDRAGPFAIYRLAKTGLTTPEPVPPGRRGGRAGGRWAAGGAEGQQAVTRQHVTVEMSMRRRARGRLRDDRGRGWSGGVAVALGYGRLRHRGQRVRDRRPELTGRACELMQGAAELLICATRQTGGGLDVAVRELLSGPSVQACAAWAGVARAPESADSSRRPSAGGGGGFAPRLAPRPRPRLIRRQWGRWHHKRLVGERSAVRAADGADFRDALPPCRTFAADARPTYQSHL